MAHAGGRRAVAVERLRVACGGGRAAAGVVASYSRHSRRSRAVCGPNGGD
jgi:hypothetical protein